jgi:hypothetical protein
MEDGPSMGVLITQQAGNYHRSKSVASKPHKESKMERDIQYYIKDLNLVIKYVHASYRKLSVVQNELNNYEKEFKVKRREFEMLQSQKEEQIAKIVANERITVGQIVSVSYRSIRLNIA